MLISSSKYSENTIITLNIKIKLKWIFSLLYISELSNKKVDIKIKSVIDKKNYEK